MFISYQQAMFVFILLGNVYSENGFSKDKEEFESFVTRIQPSKVECGKSTCDGKTQYCLNPDTGGCGTCDCKETYSKGKCDFPCHILPELFSLFGRVWKNSEKHEADKNKSIKFWIPIGFCGILTAVSIFIFLKYYQLRKKRNAPGVAAAAADDDDDEKMQKNGFKPVPPEQDPEAAVILINTASATDKYHLDETSEKIV